MNTWVTVLTTELPERAHVARVVLESNGINSILKDEFTVQNYNFASNALGGVKLQVSERDAPKAYRILVEGGFIIESEEGPSLIYTIVEKLSMLFDKQSRKKLITKRNTLIILGLITVVILSIYVRNSRILISTEKELITHDWKCLLLNFQEEIYEPNTFEPVNIDGTYYYGNTIHFFKEGTLLLPGFVKPVITAKWEYVDDSLSITECDTLGQIFNGRYKVVLEHSDLSLLNDKVWITALAQ